MQDRFAADNGPPGPSHGAGTADRDGIDDVNEAPVNDARNADCETPNALAGGRRPRARCAFRSPRSRRR